jgi:endonuclease/exonuclease/phosphatase (EEP) superfamily protein YafD
VWWVEWLASLRPQRAAALALLALAVRRLRWPACAGLLLDLGAIAALYRPRRAATGTGRLGVAGWNLQVGRHDVETVAGVLRDLDADVVILVEAFPPWSARLEAAGLPFTVQTVAGADELVVLTRGPAQLTPLPLPAGRTAVEVMVSLEGAPLRVLGVHTLAPFGTYKTLGRDAQLRALARLARERSDGVVVVGDLNVTPWVRAFRRLLADGGLLDSQRGFGPQPSWPAWPWAWFLRVPLDHALHSPDLVTVARSTGPSGGSDHRLVTVSLAWSARSRAPRP